jgi:hypothetical protein
MHFDNESRVSHPASSILETMVDRMEDIVPFLETVDAIETLEREELDDGRIRIVRRWQGSESSAPPALAAFVTPEMLAWIDTAIWTPSDFCVDWTIATSMSKLYECGGRNSFGPAPDDPEGATVMRIAGELTVYPDKVPGVPGFLARRLAPQIEKFVVNLLKPNLMDVATGLQGYLDDRG